MIIRVSVGLLEHLLGIKPKWEELFDYFNGRSYLETPQSEEVRARINTVGFDSSTDTGTDVGTVALQNHSL